MGTILQSLAQRVDGLLLFESFESSNFMLDQGWTLLNGAPAQSNNVSKDSLFSLALDSTCALIQNAPGGNFSFAAAWFYDDATQITAQCIPALMVKDSGNTAIVGLGINNAVSTTFYCALTSAGNWIATAIPRVTGWHRFSVGQVQANDSNLRLFIDNIDTGFSIVSSSVLNEIQVGCQANTGDGFGYFDLVQICLSSAISIQNLTDPQGATIICPGSVPQALSSSGAAVIYAPFLDFPVTAYLVVNAVVQVGSQDFPGAPIYQSDIMEFSGGDTWFLNRFRFGRRPSSITPQPMSSRNDLLAVDGQKQSAFFYDNDIVTLMFSDLTEDLKNQLLAWWNSAKRGEVFSVSVEENDIYLDFTQGAVSAFPIGQLLLAYPPPGPGAPLTVQSADGTIKENVVAGSSSYDPVGGLWTLNLQAPQSQAVAAGLQVRALYHWPFCTANQKQLQVTPSNVKVKRWHVQISFQEQIQDQDWMSFYAGIGI